MRKAPDVSPKADVSPGSETEEEEERWLRCFACGANIVAERARLAVNGSHEHSFMNPSGLRFVVSCWSSAPGCIATGERSTVWTWFPGFAWQVEQCRACAAHLGWSFHAATSFYGLIRDHLV